MFSASNNSILTKITGFATVAALTLGMAVVAQPNAYGKDKKKKNIVEEEAAAAARYKDNRAFWASMDKSKLVWPNPPAITRIRFLDFWYGEKFVEKGDQQQQKKKSSWMERVAGVATGETKDNKPRWQLVSPNGVAVDSKGRVFVADSKVRAIFIVDVESGNYEMIKSEFDARFKWPTGLAIDDADRLFIADSGMRRVLIMGPDKKAEGVIEGLVSPGGVAVDNDNRLLYVADAEQDLVFVYDADPPYKFIRAIGKPGTKHTSTAPGEFAKPTGVAVDQEGHLYVSDTWNNRIQVFDAEGEFIRTFGKAGDGPGYFARPKGIAIDADGHVWVADSVQDRVQAFTPEGRLLIYMGGHGILPGQFQSLANVTIDKNNRVFTTEQLPGRMQVFRYVTNAEAKAELERRNATSGKKTQESAAKSDGAGQ